MKVKKLNGCDLIMPVSGCDDIIQHIMERTPFTPNVSFHISGDAVGMAMVKENLGVYITSTLQLTQLPEGTEAREFEEDLYRTIGISLRSFKHASPAAKEFVRLAEKSCE